MEELQGKVAVVTGAASGIGLATATRFAEEGMRVVLSDIEESALDAAVTGLTAAGHEVCGVRTDVSRWEEIEQLAARTVEQYGTVHVLHNNAGVVVGGPVDELSLADWEWVLGVDLWSVIYGIKAFVPIMKAQNEGHVVNTASTAGVMAAPSIGPYNVAKFGVVAVTETLQRELVIAGSAVRATVLCPGATDTRIAESARNRDAESAKGHIPSPAEEVFLEQASRMLKHGIEPAAVAGMVVDAIRKQEFWILTHPEWKKVLTERLDSLVRDNQLSDRFGG